MAATVTDNKLSVNMVLDNGSGKTVSLPLGSLSKSAFNADKVMNIVDAFANTLSKSLVRVEKLVVSTIASGN